MDPLTLDLIHAAGHVHATVLNSLPANVRSAVAEAIASGGWPEVRVGMLNNAASIRVVVMNMDGRATELAHCDYVTA